MKQNLIENDLLDILACPVCNHDVILRDESLLCPQCRISFKIDDEIPIMLPPAMPREQLIAIHVWGEEYRDLLKNQVYEYMDQYGLKDCEILRNNYFFNKNTLLLEIGCGKGRVCITLAKESISTVGLDISIDAVKLAKKNSEINGAKSLFVCGDILCPPFKKCSFDIIFAGGSIEHFKDTKSGVAQVYELIKPNGMFIATVPYVSLSTLAQCLFTGNVPEIPILKEFYYFVHFKMLKGRKLMYGYEKSFTAQALTKMFAKVGFSNITTGLYDVEYTLKFFPEFTKSFVQNLIRLRPFWPMIYLVAKK